jgi:hypothetical protein
MTSADTHFLTKFASLWINAQWTHVSQQYLPFSNFLVVDHNFFYLPFFSTGLTPKNPSRVLGWRLFQKNAPVHGISLLEVTKIKCPTSRGLSTLTSNPLCIPFTGHTKSSARFLRNQRAWHPYFTSRYQLRIGFIVSYRMTSEGDSFRI